LVRITLAYPAHPPSHGAKSRLAPNLIWIYVTGAGIKHAMPLDWLPTSTVLKNNSGVHAPKVKQFAVTALLTLEIERLIDDAALALLKPETGFIELARASIVDYDALCRRLADGSLRGVVLDVFDSEPLPPESPLWAAPSVILTPHVSSDDEDNYGPLTIDLVFENIASWVAGKPFRNIIDRKLRY